MPIYEYRCKDCENVIEVLLGMNARQPRKCKECSGTLEKMISRTSFQLKGGGWFDQGYGAGSGTGKSSGGKSEGKSSSKPKKAAKAAGGKND
ncbi:hypothetical protein ABI59_06400 [Acidobacteria bacterium Mor1]|nr:hypothetical protein ABI59_06400 [Acidobacteria bacterium Mor1]